MSSVFDWFQCQADRSTFSVTVEQPHADEILAVLEAVKRWRQPTEQSDPEELAADLRAAIDAILVDKGLVAF